MNKKENALATYIFDNGPYPFTKEKMFIVYKVNKEDFETINKIINDIYDNVEFIDYNDFMMAFSTSFSNIRELFQTFTIDLEYETIVNEGFKISKNTSGKQFVEYINYVLTAFPKESYSNVIDICMKANNNNNSIINILKENVLNPIIDRSDIIDIINMFFKNNLNVSLTSKHVYMHRNSLINKLDKIQKLTNLNIQNFHDAYTMKILLDAIKNDEKK